MIALQTLTAWAIAASLVASHGASKLTPAIAQGMAQAALESPIIADDDRSAISLVGIEVALAWYETGGQLALDPVGSNDHGASACWAQIYLPNGARTREGWSGAELRADPLKCARVAVRLIKASLAASLAASPACDLCGLVVYARGRDSEEARRLSRNRMGLAVRLVRDVPIPSELP